MRNKETIGDVGENNSRPRYFNFAAVDVAA